jgi:hypothetical protein
MNFERSENENGRASAPAASFFLSGNAVGTAAISISGVFLCFRLSKKLARLADQQGRRFNQVAGLKHQRFCTFPHLACRFYGHFVTPPRGIVDSADFLHVPIPD